MTDTEKRPYDALWEGDPRRQDAQRGAGTRFPDHSAGNLPASDPVGFWAVLGAGAAVGLAVVVGLVLLA